MEEKIFFNKDGVTVSSSLLVVRGRKYAISEIRSITSVQNDPNRTVPVFLIFLTIVFLNYFFIGYYSNMNMETAIDRGFLVIIFGISSIVWWCRQKTTYEIFLDTSFGTILALTSEDLEYVQTVAIALNDAIKSDINID